MSFVFSGGVSRVKYHLTPICVHNSDMLLSVKLWRWQQFLFLWEPPVETLTVPYTMERPQNSCVNCFPQLNKMLC